MNHFDLVEQSFRLVQKNKSHFTTVFYQKLFEKSPQLKPLFLKTDLSKQSEKLYGSLVLLVENLNQPETLKAVLGPLGEKHKNYGAIEQHYPLVGEVLIETLKECTDGNWNTEIEKAWIDTYTAVVKMMLEGTESAPTDEDLANEADPMNTHEKVEEEVNFKPTKELTYLQKVRLNNKRNFWSKVNRWFWRTPKWMIALYAALFFFVISFVGQEVPFIQLIIDTLEPLSIFIAVLIFIKELPERKRQFHYQAWSIIDEATGIDNSQARIIALEDLCDDGVSLNGIDLEGARLEKIEMNGGVVSNANLRKTKLTNAELFYANLTHSDLSEADCSGIILFRSNLSFANFQKANCASANFGKANLMFADLRNGNFSGANFAKANLKGVNFEGAYLSGANLKGANVTLDDLQKAYLVDAILPDGSIG